MTALRTISADESTDESTRRTRRSLDMRTLLVAGASLFGAMTLAERAGAQVAAAPGRAATGATDIRWAPYLGCWSPPTDDPTIGLSRSGGGTREAVCVTPTSSPNIVEVASIVNGRKIAAETVDASGTRVAKTVDGCKGWEAANWSSDGHRLLLRSEFTCPNALLRKSSGVFALATDGSWVDVEGIDVNGASGVRVIRLRDIGVDGSAFQTIARAAVGDSVGLGMSGRTAMQSLSVRLAASAPVDANDILEVTRAIDAPVAQAWFAGLEQEFDVDGRTLVRLADEGIPGGIIDLMVAKAYPDRFSIGGTGAATGEPRNALSRVRSRNSLAGLDSFEAALLSCPLSVQQQVLSGGMLQTNHPCLTGVPMFGRSRIGAYGYGYDMLFLGNGFGGLGYNSFGFNRGYYGNVPFYGQPPIVIVNNPGNSGNGTGGRQGARAVRGSGYTRDSGPESRPSSTPRASEPSSGGASGSSSPASSGGGGATQVRTAKPKGGGGQ